MDYPENANIIDHQEQQSDYYDRYTCFTTSNYNVMCAVRLVNCCMFCRTKAVFFVLIVYYWDHQLG